MPFSSMKKTKSSLGASRRPPIERGRWAAKGTKPLPEQPSVTHVLTVVLISICRKVLFIQTEVKITLYSIGLFFGSLIFDFLPFPKMYLSNKDNFFNQYYVKISWGWTLLVVGCFIISTATVYGCGKREIIKKHMMRLVVATVFWYFWAQWFFTKIENMTGACLGKAILKNKYKCINQGFQWHAFDISGHAFILVYINLLLVEEAKAIIGWEGIKDLIRFEDHRRSDPSEQTEESALGHLSSEDFCSLKDNFTKWTPFIRVIFICMTFMSLLSDIMLTCTVMYFHTMPQKVAGGFIAIATWFFTYRFWFKKKVSPGLPGAGLFKYQEEDRREGLARRRSSINRDARVQGMFMGMRLNAQREARRREPDSNEQSTDEPRPDPESKYGPRPDFFSQEPKNRRR